MKLIIQTFLILFFSTSFLLAGDPGDLPGEETTKPEEMFDVHCICTINDIIRIT